MNFKVYWQISDWFGCSILLPVYLDRYFSNTFGGIHNPRSRIDQTTSRSCHKAYHTFANSCNIDNYWYTNIGRRCVLERESLTHCKKQNHLIYLPSFDHRPSVIVDNIPLKNPPNPSSLAPSIGFVATPVTPSKTPITSPRPLRAKLSPKFC